MEKRLLYNELLISNAFFCKNIKNYKNTGRKICVITEIYIKWHIKYTGEWIEWRQRAECLGCWK